MSVPLRITPRPVQAAATALFLAATVFGGQAWAQNDGQADLEKATEARLSIKSVDDLTKVIGLLESSLEKGLDEENTEFANSLLGSSLIQRGTVFARSALATPPRDPKFAERRETALKELERALTLTPEQPEALYLVALLSGNDSPRAAEAIDKAIEFSEDEPRLKAKALTLRASIEKEPKKKLADLDEAIRLVPTDAAAIRTRGLLNAGRGDFEAGLADLDKALELAPNHAPTSLLKAMVLTGLQKYDEALVCLDKVRELQPNATKPLMEMARIHSVQDNLDAALHVLDQAHEINPKDLAVLMMRSGIHERLDDVEKALADIDAVLKLNPNAEPAVWQRAVLLAGSDRFDQAVSELKERAEKTPENIRPLMQLALLHVAESKHGLAKDFFSDVLAKNGDNWLALRGRGDASLNLGEHQPALVDYERALKIQKDDTGILNNLAWLLATSPDEKLRDGKRAIELATKACELTKYRQAHIISTLAAAHAETGDFKSAVESIEKALEVAREEQKEPLAKELESYRAEKPWRERLSQGKRQDDGDTQENPE